LPTNAVHTTDAPAPVAAYSQAVRKGGLLQVAGQGPVDPAAAPGSGYEGDTAAEQTRQTLRNVRAILRAGGADLSDVLMMRVYLTRTEDFAGMNAAMEEFYAEHGTDPYPARTTVYVGLPPGMLVEIDALAAVDR
jgi:reactive intermediate/imine deaminase